MLAGVGVVVDQRRGRERVWTLRTEPLDEARHTLETVSAQWDRALARLKAFTER